METPRRGRPKGGRGKAKSPRIGRKKKRTRTDRSVESPPQQSPDLPPQQLPSDYLDNPESTPEPSEFVVQQTGSQKGQARLDHIRQRGSQFEVRRSHSHPAKPVLDDKTAITSAVKYRAADQKLLDAAGAEIRQEVGDESMGEVLPLTVAMETHMQESDPHEDSAEVTPSTSYTIPPLGVSVQDKDLVNLPIASTQQPRLLSDPSTMKRHIDLGSFRVDGVGPDETSVCYSSSDFTGGPTQYYWCLTPGPEASSVSGVPGLASDTCGGMKEESCPDVGHEKLLDAAGAEIRQEVGDESMGEVLPLTIAMETHMQESDPHEDSAEVTPSTSFTIPRLRVSVQDKDLVNLPIASTQQPRLLSDPSTMKKHIDLGSFRVDGVGPDETSVLASDTCGGMKEESCPDVGHEVEVVSEMEEVHTPIDSQLDPQYNGDDAMPEEVPYEISDVGLAGFIAMIDGTGHCGPCFKCCTWMLCDVHHDCVDHSDEEHCG